MSPNQHHLLTQLRRTTELLAADARTTHDWALRTTDDAHKLTALVTAFVASNDHFDGVRSATDDDGSLNA